MGNKCVWNERMTNVKLRRVMNVTQVESESHRKSDSTPSTVNSYLCLQCACGGDEWVKWGWQSTLRAWSLSSSWATSLPQACAILFPATRLPTIIEAGPTSVQHNHIHHHTCQWRQGSTFILTLKHTQRWTNEEIKYECKPDLPGCFCLGLGRLVTHVWGHMRTLQGCKAPSRKRCLVSDMWMPPRGALGSVLAGTRARQ